MRLPLRGQFPRIRIRRQFRFIRRVVLNLLWVLFSSLDLAGFLSCRCNLIGRGFSVAQIEQHEYSDQSERGDTADDRAGDEAGGPT
jgi:hypothetical protein